MADGDEGQEDKFFRAKAREDSFVGHVGPPPPRWRTFALAGGIALLLGGVALWHFRSPVEGTLWIHNPGPGPVTVEIDGASSEIRAGKLLDLTVRGGAPLEIAVLRGEERRTLQAAIGIGKTEVDLIDLGGDAGYVVLDVSAHYGETGSSTTALPLLHLSEPKEAHRLPFPALKLVRPGSPLPEKGSWDLQAFRAPGKPIQVFKVFRVDGKRLADQDQLVKILSESVAGGSGSAYENLRVPIKTSTVPSGTIIPPAGS